MAAITPTTAADVYGSWEHMQQHNFQRFAFFDVTKMVKPMNQPLLLVAGPARSGRTVNAKAVIKALGAYTNMVVYYAHNGTHVPSGVHTSASEIMVHNQSTWNAEAHEALLQQQRNILAAMASASATVGNDAAIKPTMMLLVLDDVQSGVEGEAFDKFLDEASKLDILVIITAEKPVPQLMERAQFKMITKTTDATGYDWCAKFLVCDPEIKTQLTSDYRCIVLTPAPGILWFHGAPARADAAQAVVDEIVASDP